MAGVYCFISHDEPSFKNWGDSGGRVRGREVGREGGRGGLRQRSLINHMSCDDTATHIIDQF